MNLSGFNVSRHSQLLVLEEYFRVLLFAGKNNAFVSSVKKMQAFTKALEELVTIKLLFT